jgi:hypothetical protein
MKNNTLADHVRKTGSVPLSWAGSTMAMDYLNIGDALSPVMVALLSGRPVHRVPSRSTSLRMACVGSIGHGFEGGEVWFWGTGSSRWKNPSAPKDELVPFVPSDDSRFRVTATRGPLSEALLTGGPEGSVGVYGDPVWLLPRFYAPKIEKTWKLGVIVHLSELSDRDPEAHLKETLKRYRIPEALAPHVRLINTVTPISVDAMKTRIDEILACERIVSTSLHGMVFAESYGIPCLHFTTQAATTRGLQTRVLDKDCDLDPRVIDLYRGLGLSELPVYAWPQSEATDWHDLMAAIDAAWTEKPFDADALISAFPLDLAPLEPRAGETIWDHPVLKSLVLQHDVKLLNLEDRQRSKA